MILKLVNHPKIYLMLSRNEMTKLIFNVTLQETLIAFCYFPFQEVEPIASIPRIICRPTCELQG